MFLFSHKECTRTSTPNAQAVHDYWIFIFGKFTAATYAYLGALLVVMAMSQIGEFIQSDIYAQIGRHKSLVAMTSLHSSTYSRIVISMKTPPAYKFSQHLISTFYTKSIFFHLF